MSDFHKVSAALTTMQGDVSPGGSSVQSAGSATKRSPHSGAPLASAEDIDQHGYAVPRDNVNVAAKAAAAAAAQAAAHAQAAQAQAAKAQGNSPMASGGPNEYAQPIDQHHQLPAARKSRLRERREQIAMQQGKIYRASFLKIVISKT